MTGARRSVLALVALAALFGCSRVGDGGAPGDAASRGILRIGSPDEPDNLNPMFAHTDATDQVDAFIFAPVFRYDARGNFVPELATEVPTYANGGISRDSKTIVLHWRRGVRWSDGAPLTARDLRFTWRAVRNPANNTKLVSGWDDIDAIDVPDDYTAILRLRRPNADVLGSLGGGGGSAYPPLPEHLLGKLPDLNRAAFNAAPISSGPWTLAKWNHGSSLEFVPNPTYWRGPPKLRGISFRVVPNPDTLVTQLATHEIDVLPNVPEQQVGAIGNVAGIRVVRALSANWRRLDMNCAKPALSDVRVRRAIAEAIDWDRLDRTVYHGLNVRARSDIFPQSWAAPKIPLVRYDPTEARALLDAAGFVPGPGGVRRRGDVTLHLTISATTKPGNAEAELQMQQDLHAIGIALEIKNYPASLLFALEGPLYGGRYDLEWSIDTNGPDPDNQGNWSADFLPPHGANTSFLRDPVITQTSDAAIRTFDRAKRKALYQREEERIHELVPAVFLYWENTTTAYDARLRGYAPAAFITNNWNSYAWTR